MKKKNQLKNSSLKFLKKIIKVTTKANKPMCDSSNANPCVYFRINFINQKEPKTVIHHTNNTNARFIFENSVKKLVDPS